MTVTIVCDVLGEENNGTTVATMNLVRYLKSRGDTVRILCADQSRKDEENTFVVPNIELGVLHSLNLMKRLSEIRCLVQMQFTLCFRFSLESSQCVLQESLAFL